MTKRNLVMFALVMMVMNVMAQDLLGIDMDKVQVVRVGGSSSSATTAAPTRTVSVRQLAAANNRTASRRTTRSAQTTAYANQTAQQNDMQSQLQAAAAASSMQVVVCGIVRGFTPCGTGMRKMLVESDGMFGAIREYTLVGYQYPTIKIAKGDHICFIATDNGSYAYPMVNYSEVINSTGMVRYMNEYQRHHIGLGTSPYAGKMSKWASVINGINTGLYATASVVSIIKLIKDIF